jgi:hypothetical protein
MRIWVAVLLGAGLIGLGGCKSAYVEADVVNETGAAVTLVEVDYPSASFGVEQLAAGGVYHYRFKVLGSGPTTVTWTDAHRTQHTAKGPELHEGQAGVLRVELERDAAKWVAKL